MSQRSGNRQTLRMTESTDRLRLTAPPPSDRELLRAALCPAEQAEAAWTQWRVASDIDKPPGRAYELLPAVSAALPDALLGNDASRLKGLRRRTWFASQTQLSALTGALDTLAEIGIVPILIKGGNLATSVYDEPGTRPMADTDIVVGTERFDEAIAALTAHGWSASGDWVHAVDMVDARGNGVDVHRWALFPRFCREVEHGWYERAELSTVLQTPVRRLALSDELVLTVVHGLMTNSPSSSRWPIDVAHIVTATCTGETTSRAFWEDVIVSANEIGVAAIVADGLALCSEEFCLPVPADALAALRRQRLDPLLRVQWARRTRGHFPAMRSRRFVDLERAAGRRPSLWRYIHQRWTALREHGIGAVARARFKTARRGVRQPQF